MVGQPRSWFARKDSSQPERINVHAQSGGVAAGRDVRDSIVNIGLNEDEVVRRFERAQQPLADQISKLIRDIAREKGIPAAPLRAILLKLGESNVPDADIPERLNAAADQLISLRTQLGRLSNERPELSAIRRHALALLDSGDLDGARAALHRGRDEARLLREEAIRNEVEFIVNEADIDHLQLAYRAAAKKYGQAASLISTYDSHYERFLLEAEASELCDQGEDFGDKGATLDAIALYRRILALSPIATSQDRAMLRYKLASAFLLLGRRDNVTTYLEEALRIFRDILPLFTFQIDFGAWAAIQNGIAATLMEIGQREDGIAHLEQALDTYNEMFKSRGAALERAASLLNIGAVLRVISSREAGTSRLKQVVSTYLQALSLVRRKQSPGLWAVIHHNLGIAYTNLGRRQLGEESAKSFEQAISSFNQALKEHRQKRSPMQWADTQSALGDALFRTGDRRGDRVSLLKAISAFKGALTVYTQEGAPQDWTQAKKVLGDALLALAELKKAPEFTEEALANYKEILPLRMQESSRFELAATRNSMGIAFMYLAEWRSIPSFLEQALTEFQEALALLSSEVPPFERGSIENNLAHILYLLGKNEKGTERLTQAASAYKAALANLAPGGP